MSEDSPDLVDLLEVFERRLLDSVHTAMPGRVEGYDPATQRADVQPLIRQRVPKADTDQQEWVYEDLPLIPSVRVIHPRGGGAFVHLPIDVGDFVLLVFCETGIGHWEAGNGDLSDAGDERRHHLAHAVAIPGFFPATKNIADVNESNQREIVAGFDGGAKLRMKPNGDVQIDTDGTITLAGAGAAQFMARADRADAAIEQLRTALNTHSHVVAGSAATLPSPVAVTGTASPTASLPAPLSSTAADQVKGK